jgi:hypothetical protein
VLERSGRENKAVVSRRGRRVRREKPNQLNSLSGYFFVFCQISFISVSSACSSEAGERKFRLRLSCKECSYIEQGMKKGRETSL